MIYSIAMIIRNSSSSATTHAPEPSMADTNRDRSDDTALPPFGLPSLVALGFLVRVDEEVEADEEEAEEEEDDAEADEEAEEEADEEANDAKVPARGKLPGPLPAPVPLPSVGMATRTPLSDPRRLRVLAPAPASSSSSFDDFAPFLPPLLPPDFPAAAADDDDDDDDDAAAEADDADAETELENDQPLPSLSCSVPTSLTTDMDCNHGRRFG
jgi:hypothetical protein